MRHSNILFHMSKIVSIIVKVTDIQVYNKQRVFRMYILLGK